MTNEQILKKVLKKAGYTEASKDDDLIIRYLDSGYWAEIIYSHSFAKAFWGEEEELCNEFNDKIMYPTWKYHLKQMVLEEEPLKYLEKFI